MATVGPCGMQPNDIELMFQIWLFFLVPIGIIVGAVSLLLWFIEWRKQLAMV